MSAATLSTLVESVGETVTDAVATGVDLVHDLATTASREVPELTDKVSRRASTAARQATAPAARQPSALPSAVGEDRRARRGAGRDRRGRRPPPEWPFVQRCGRRVAGAHRARPRRRDRLTDRPAAGKVRRQASSAWRRIASKLLRSSRDTCICEIPTRSAISVCDSSA